MEITWFGYLQICYGKENKKCNVNNKEAAPSFDSIHSKHNPIIGINKFHQHSVINSSQSGRQPQAQSISIRTIEKLSKTVNPLNPDFLSLCASLLSPFYPFFHHWNFTKFCQKLTLKWNEDELILELTIDAPNHPNPESILDVSVYKYDLSSPVKHSNAPSFLMPESTTLLTTIPIFIKTLYNSSSSVMFLLTTEMPQLRGVNLRLYRHWFPEWVRNGSRGRRSCRVHATPRASPKASTCHR